LISDDELLAAIDAAEQQALGSLQGEIASDRADAIDRYLGKEYGDEQAGRSRVVSRDVSDVVEGVLANVLKPFVGGDQVVQFDPRGPEDVEAAQQETDYVNFVALERNNGFLVLNSAVKDALLLRAGYVKASWTVRKDIVTETYFGQSDEEIALLLKDKDVEVVQHSESPDPMSMGAMDQMGMPVPPRMLHDVKVKRSRPTEFVEITPTPPDEILVSQRTRTPSLQEADFVQHRCRVPLSQLREMGYKVEDDIGDDEDGDTLEEFARQRFGTQTEGWDDVTSDPARRIVMFKESYIRIDRDGDGIAELRKVCQVGKTILADEDADLIPFACFSSVLMPHQHLGLSVYDLIKDLAQIKTALMRSYLDNRYLQNNGRSIIDVNRVNLDDLVVSRPGGVVRVDGDPTTAVLPLITPDTGTGALQGLEYLDVVRENRTGFTRSAAGLKSDSLKTDTLGEYNSQLNQSQMRLEMISRTIAETGVRSLFIIVHALTLKHSTKEEKVRIRNKWIAVNPREWSRRTDLSISVGLGSASPHLQMQNLMVLGQAQEKAMMMGLVQPSNVYNLLKKITNAAGFKSPEEFFTEPKKDPQTGQDAPPPQQKDPLVQAEEVKGQFSLQGKQIDGQAKGMEVQAKGQQEAQKMMMEAQLRREEMANELTLEREKMAMEFEFKRWEAELKQQTEIQSAQITCEADERRASMDAQIKDRDSERSAEVERKRADNEVETAKTVARAGGKDVDGKIEQVLAGLAQAMQQLVEAQGRPRKIIRGKDGRAEGVVVQ
jgi:hypothetical protein